MQSYWGVLVDISCCETATRRDSSVSKAATLTTLFLSFVKK